MEIIDFHDDSNKYRFTGNIYTILIIVYIVMEKYDGDLSILMNQKKQFGFTEMEQIDAI